MFSVIISIQLFSQDLKGIEYKNMQVGVSSHSMQLMNESKATPVYAEMKYKFYDGTKAVPYVKGDMGYSYVSDESSTETALSDIADNKYYSVGAGVDLNDLSLEVAYENYLIDPIENESDGRMVLKFDYKY